jgi:hypothetical protein
VIIYAAAAPKTITVATYGGAIGCASSSPYISRNIIIDNNSTIGAGITVVEGNAKVISNLI